VTARPESIKVRKGEKLTVHATSLPATRKQSIVLQIRKKGDRWVNVARDRANKHGRAELVAKAPDKKGTYTYRVVAVGTPVVLAGASAEFTISVRK
jgi:5-hydroxyisourate hydrolase-like protein (transthyretin family)